MAKTFMRKMRKACETHGRGDLSEDLEKGRLQMEFGSFFSFVRLYARALAVVVVGDTAKAMLPPELHASLHIGDTDLHPFFSDPLLCFAFSLSKDGAGALHGHWEPLVVAVTDDVFEVPLRWNTFASREDYSTFGFVDVFFIFGTATC